MPQGRVLPASGAPRLAFPTRPGEALRSGGGLLGQDLESVQAFLSDTKHVV